MQVWSGWIDATCTAKLPPHPLPLISQKAPLVALTVRYSGEIGVRVVMTILSLVPVIAIQYARPLDYRTGKHGVLGRKATH